MTTALDTAERLVGELDRALGPDYTAVLFGSGARGDWDERRSDINLLLLLPALDVPTLRRLGRPLAQWGEVTRTPALVFSRDEWKRVADAFPIELTDMRLAYRVLRGPDPLASFRVDPRDLRRALEHEFRGKLLRLRQAYALGHGDGEALAEAARASLRSLLVLLRALLALFGKPVPASAGEVVAQAGAATGVPAAAIERLVRHRDDPAWRCPDAEFEGYLAAVEAAVAFVDHLPIGES